MTLGLMNGGRGTILLVDDDENDQTLFEQSLLRAGCPIHLVALQDGRKALEYLKAEGQFTDRNQFPLPKLVFLDSLLPAVSGGEVLKFIKSNPGLRRIPVVILTGGISPTDVCKMYDLGANAVCLKPASVNDLHAFAASVCQFWMRGTISGQEE